MPNRDAHHDGDAATPPATPTATPRVTPTATPTVTPTATPQPVRHARPGAGGRRSGQRLRGPELTASTWQQHGACRTEEVSAFFSPDVKGEPPNVRMQRLVRAKRVCARCPVRELCRSYALENEEEFGVWGGLSEIERKHLIAERRGAQTGQRIP